MKKKESQIRKNPLLRLIASGTKNLFRTFSLIGNSKFYEHRHFPWMVNLEKNYTKIKQELINVMQEDIPNFQDISPAQRKLTQDDKWKTYFLYIYGNKVVDNCKNCPQTVECLSRIPGMTTAFFSILHPHKYLPSHKGPYAGVLRYHLALMVPNESHKCGIRVGGQEERWIEGKSLIFDDTYEHEAWNKSDEIRVVLFVDFLRPLPSLLDALNKRIVRIVGDSEYINMDLRNIDVFNAGRDKRRTRIA